MPPTVSRSAKVERSWARPALPGLRERQSSKYCAGAVLDPVEQGLGISRRGFGLIRAEEDVVEVQRASDRVLHPIAHVAPLDHEDHQLDTGPVEVTGARSLPGAEALCRDVDAAGLGGLCGRDDYARVKRAAPAASFSSQRSVTGSAKLLVRVTQAASYACGTPAGDRKAPSTSSRSRACSGNATVCVMTPST